MFSIRNVFSSRSLWAERIVMILAGVLYPLGFAPIDIWPLTLISVALLINEIIVVAETDNYLKNDKPGQEYSQSLSFFSLIFYWSLGAFGVGVSWVYVSIHEFGHVPIAGAVAISFLLVLTLSLIKASSGYLIGRLTRQLGVSLLLIILPMMWVVFEIIQTFIFSGFPWLFAGYTQIDGPLWKLSTWLGVYGVSWFMVALVTCLVFIVRSRHKTKQTSLNSAEDIPSQKLLWAVFVAVLSVPVLAQLIQHEKISANRESIDVALVQPNIPQEQKWDRQHFSRIIDVLYEQSSEHWNSDLIIWPEGAIPAYQHQVVDILSDLNNRALQSKTDLLLGLPIYLPKDDVSYSALISLGESRHVYQKQVLVPFGEYVPLGAYLRGLIKFLNLPMSSFSPATSKQVAMNFGDYQVIPAICYEITYPGIVHQLVKDADQSSDQAKLLVTVSNDAWFGDSLGPYQHMQMARMRALELGMPLVRSTNDGITGVVDASGNILRKIDRYQQQTLRYKVSLENKKTPYRQFGLTGIYLILIMNLLVLVVSYFRNSHK